MTGKLMYQVKEHGKVIGGISLTPVEYEDFLNAKALLNSVGYVCKMYEANEALIVAHAEKRIGKVLFTISDGTPIVNGDRARTPEPINLPVRIDNPVWIIAYVNPLWIDDTDDPEGLPQHENCDVVLEFISHSLYAGLDLVGKLGDYLNK